MVRLENLRRGVMQKWLYLGNHSVQLTPHLDTVYLGVCSSTRWHHFCGNDIMGCVQVHDRYPGWFSVLENTHNKERYNLECSYCVLK